jgi:serine O-acetyltransferase
MSLALDITRYLNQSPGYQALGDTPKRRVGAVVHHQIVCVILYRLSHYLYVKSWTRLARTVARLNYFLLKTNISPASCIGDGLLLPHPAGVTFHGRAGNDLTLYAVSICGPNHPWIECPVEAGPLLGDRVTVGARASILGPVTVGGDTRIAFRVDLQQDAPAEAVVVARSMRSPGESRARPG